MIRATVWTTGLFGAGTAICRVFPSSWVEPLVLVLLGLALLFVSARGAVRPGDTERTPGSADAEAVARGAAPSHVGAASQVSAAPAPVDWNPVRSAQVTGAPLHAEQPA